MTKTTSMISLLLVALIPAVVTGQTTAFNFQGRLNDGSNPANGQYDLQFRLYDAITGGTQIGPVVNRPNLTLINGVFSTTLNFGPTAFDSGNRFLEIWVKPSSLPNGYVVLGARQQILSVPLAVRAISAVDAENATNAQNSVNAQNATNATNAQNASIATNATFAQTAQNASSLGGISPSGFAKLNAPNTGELSVDGNIRQPLAFNGTPKLMALVNADNSVAYCYNAITNSTTPPCGLTITRVSTAYWVGFPFPLTNRYVFVTPFSSGLSETGVNINIAPSAPANLVVRIFDLDAGFPTASFMVIAY